MAEGAGRGKGLRTGPGVAQLYFLQERIEENCNAFASIRPHLKNNLNV
ncbi:hypothetical protein ROTO_23440 [Roseovarius tolerans]|uniref:Uncharacterized protein n=1 Tax=Roseovarius tolerans TaxID=74031 RepID=A0A0L6CTN3_9RHOB|nr:hypothetical protein ROTO_23440 [Roseovarius tolerans]